MGLELTGQQIHWEAWALLMQLNLLMWAAAAPHAQTKEGQAVPWGVIDYAKVYGAKV